MNINKVQKRIEWEQYYNPKFDWDNTALYKNNILSDEFIEEFTDKINWFYLLIHQKVNIKLLFKYSEKINNWDYLSRFQTLSEDFIEKFSNKVNWAAISAIQKLSEKFIEKHADKIDWNNISAHQQLSEPFIREFKDKVNWRWISVYQKLSEAFIKEFKNRVDWDCISIHQKHLSPEFITKWKDMLGVDID